MEKFDSSIYEDFRNNRQGEFNDLDIKFAFCEKQFNEMLDNFEGDIVYIGNGGYISKKDLPKLHKLLDKKDFFEVYKDNKEAIEGAYWYELNNHEAIYCDLEQVIFDLANCFGVNESFIKNDKRFWRVYRYYWFNVEG